MNRWKLTFEYDGRDFSGWQIQPDQRTVEGEVERAFSTLFQTNIDVVGQGRTDAGVHARAQVGHADLPVSASRNRLLHAMKGLLPSDVALIDAEKTDHDFHSRFHAVSRRYSYQHIARKSPLMRERAWYSGYSPDIKILSELSSLIVGKHDFKNFCIPPDDVHLTTICTISISEWIEKDAILIFTIEGNRFLRHMVRRLVGSMIKTASGKADKARFLTLLTDNDAEQKAHSAPPCGLYLNEVIYKKTDYPYGESY